MRLIDADALLYTLEATGLLKNSAEMIAVQSAIDAAPTITPPPNNPLTLSELQEMHNRPVWVVLNQEDVSPVNGYGIVDSEYECVKGLNYLFSFEDYGTWIAYLHEPDGKTE